GGRFGYSALELGDWRRDIINRVTARLAPGTPGLHIVNRATADAPAGSAGTVYLDLPDASDGAEPGDLLLVVIASTVHAAGQEWETPPGWKEYRGDLRDAQGRLRIYAKKLEETDLGTTVTFYTDTAKAGGAWEEFVFHVKNWYGDIEQGVVVSDSSVYGPPNSAHVAANGINTPPVVFPDWGPEVSLFVSIRAGMHNFGPVTVGPVNDDIGPPGYGNVNGHAVTSPAKGGAAVAFQWAVRDACVEVEEPGPWTSGDAFRGFIYSETATIAVRGVSGDAPEVQGGQVGGGSVVASRRGAGNTRPPGTPPSGRCCRSRSSPPVGPPTVPRRSGGGLVTGCGSVRRTRLVGSVSPGTSTSSMFGTRGVTPGSCGRSPGSCPRRDPEARVQ